MLCDLCLNEVKQCAAINREHLEILENSGRLADKGVSTLPNWICDECDGNLKNSKLQIKGELELPEIKNEIQDFNDVSNCMSWPHVDSEFIDIKAENIDTADDKNTIKWDSENLEEDANLCKACSKICYLKDLNENGICNECCSLENGSSDMQHCDIEITQNASINHVAVNRLRLNKNFKNLDGTYICTLCPEGKSQRYKVPSNVRKHIRVTHFGRRYECSECGALYTSSTSMRSHYKTTHGIEDRIENLNSTSTIDEDTESDNEFDCDNTTHFIPDDEPSFTDFAVCNTDEVVNTIGVEENSLQKESNSYKCQFCPDDQTSLDFKSMQEHIELHVLRYLCIECNQRYMVADLLRHHYATYHNTYGPKELKVIIIKNLPKNQGQDCDQNSDDDYKKTAYAVIENKLKFRKLINEIKNDNGSYVCNICPNGHRKYRAQKGARQHIRSHHFGYRHPCTVCQKMLTGRDNARKHLKRVHGDLKDISAALIPIHAVVKNHTP